MSKSQTAPPAPSRNGSDLRGINRLTTDAIVGVADLVEAVHANVLDLPGVLGKSVQRKTGGIPGLVYRSVRGTARLVGGGVDMALARLSPLLSKAGSPPRREALLAALNGVLGDHLAATGNPLAIPSRLRSRGQALVLERRALARSFPAASGKLLVMAHGLCMNDLQWRRDGHDHGEELAGELGSTRLDLHYNTGLHISDNGRNFAHLLEKLVAAWPVPVESIAIVGHSMGGLVARSACCTAAARKQKWLARLDSLIFLGTPHHGAPLERAGSWVDMLIGLSPYSAPFARLGKLRSAGIQDLRHGNVRSEDWRHRSGEGLADGRTPLPLPDGVRCYAIATTTGAARKDKSRDGSRSDGLVAIASALGQHPDPAFDLRIPVSRRWVGYGINHLQLLSDATVYQQLLGWLSSEPRVRAARPSRKV